MLGHGGSFVVGYPVRTTRTVKEPPPLSPQINTFWDIPRSGTDGATESGTRAALGSRDVINTDTGMPDDPALVDYLRQQGPPAPEGVDIDSNIEAVHTFAALAPQHIVGWWLNRVRPMGLWDYKYQFGWQFEAFGNFNCGVTGRAIGLSVTELKRGAGAAAFIFRGSSDGGSPFGSYPYGDTYRDQRFIYDGTRYYDSRF